MDFITGFDHVQCNKCKTTFLTVATAHSHPYDDYSCDQCEWRGALCGSCASTGCPECSGSVKSTNESASEESGGNIMY
ncbi:MAG: hypothetical protein U9N52_09725 [Campylobacterota bacterium]|nr:hypothetical protein [Campylobacterota bacterium]